MRNLIWIVLAVVIAGGVFLLYSGQTPQEVIEEATDALTTDETVKAAGAAVGEKPMSQRIVDRLGSTTDVVIDWGATKHTEISSLDLCDVNLDLPGGIAIGTAATSTMAGNSVLAIIGSGGVLVVSAPAIATGVTLTAIVGSTVYLGSKGYCYFKD